MILAEQTCKLGGQNCLNTEEPGRAPREKEQKVRGSKPLERRGPVAEGRGRGHIMTQWQQFCNKYIHVSNQHVMHLKFTQH